ncbi:MAG: hypothetical protein QOK29_782 [Rhodospirillaceae bacterium]|jgi:hypothetical protein|nr:hypothetical protein [Rhodospirillaceae bacterium]
MATDNRSAHQDHEDVPLKDPFGTSRKLIKAT